MNQKHKKSEDVNATTTRKLGWKNLMMKTTLGGSQT